jgi:hypothetical protein
MEMDEYEKILFDLLKYVDFIKEKNDKIQISLSVLPSFYSDKIQYDNPRTLEEDSRKKNIPMSRAEGDQSSKRLGMKR